MIAHEFPEGERFCKWCGALQHAQMTATCLERPDKPTSDMAPEPQRRQLAHEDFDAISARIAEIRKEQQDALNIPTIPDIPPESPAPEAGDGVDYYGCG